MNLPETAWNLNQVSLLLRDGRIYLATTLMPGLQTFLLQSPRQHIEAVPTEKRFTQQLLENHKALAPCGLTQIGEDQARS